MDSETVDSIGIFYMFIGMPLCCYTYLSFINKREENIISIPIKAFKRESDIEMYVNIIIDLIETREQPISRYDINIIFT